MRRGCHESELVSCKECDIERSDKEAFLNPDHSLVLSKMKTFIGPINVVKPAPYRIWI